jgi:hypothetical protein
MWILGSMLTWIKCMIFKSLRSYTCWFRSYILDFGGDGICDSFLVCILWGRVAQIPVTGWCFPNPHWIGRWYSSNKSLIHWFGYGENKVKRKKKLNMDVMVSCLALVHEQNLVLRRQNVLCHVGDHLFAMHICYSIIYGTDAHTGFQSSTCWLSTLFCSGILLDTQTTIPCL